MSGEGELEIGSPIASGPTLILEDGTTISGGGTLTLDETSDSILVQAGDNAQTPEAGIDNVSVTNSGTIEVDTGATLTLDGDTTVSGGTLALDDATSTLQIENSVVISGNISLSGGTVALTSGAGLTLEDDHVSNTTINAGSFVALTDPAAATVPFSLQAVAIDSAGDVVGNYVDVNDANRSFFYSNGTYTAIDDPNAPLPITLVDTAVGTVATSLNDTQTVAGYYYSNDGGAHGFTWSTAAGYTTIDDPNAVDGSGNDLAGGTSITSIDTSGDVVGYYQATPGGWYTAFLYNSATQTFSDLTPTNSIGIDSSAPVLISDGGRIAGTYIGSDDAAYGFVYDSNTGQYTTINDPNANNIAGVYGTVIEGLNDLGAVVGYYDGSDDANHGFVATPDGSGGYNYTDLNDPNAVAGGTTYAQAINDTGEVVGYYLDGHGDPHAFLYTGGVSGTYYDLTSFNGEALAINGDNQIVGFYDFGNGIQDAFLSGTTVNATLILSSGTTVSDSTLTSAAPVSWTSRPSADLRSRSTIRRSPTATRSKSTIRRRTPICS